MMQMYKAPVRESLAGIFHDSSPGGALLIVNPCVIAFYDSYNGWHFVDWLLEKMEGKEAGREWSGDARNRRNNRGALGEMGLAMAE
jgi:hypothetical protein